MPVWKKNMQEWAKYLEKVWNIPGNIHGRQLQIDRVGESTEKWHIVKYTFRWKYGYLSQSFTQWKVEVFSNKCTQVSGIKD